jgi:hypothetical protein
MSFSALVMEPLAFLVPLWTCLATDGALAKALRANGSISE